MIYHKIISSNLFEIFLNLQELMYLSNLTNQKCSIILNSYAKKYFDLDGFNLVGAIPDNSSKVDLSKFICMFDKDISELSAQEFIKKQNSTVLRLDKFNTGNIEVEFSKPHNFRDKYFFPHEISPGWNTHVKFKADLLNKLEFIKKLFPTMPLLYINQETMLPLDLEFSSCYYVSTISEPNTISMLEKNKIAGTNLEQKIFNYHPSFQEYDLLFFVYLMKSNFSQIKCINPEDDLINQVLTFVE